LPEDVRGVIRNNGGGHVNHTMFWQIMGQKKGGNPTGAVADAINKTFGSFDAFKEKFEAAGVNQFGSGWAWLGLKRNPVSLRSLLLPTRTIPFPTANFLSLANDVWEHAYYLKYQNRRPDYLKPGGTW